MPHVPPGLRIYAIGDVHGSLEKLESLELLIAEDAKLAAGKVQIVMTGDYVDRGLQSREVLDHIIAAKAKDNRITLAGNHDVWLPFKSDDHEIFKVWCRYGGVTTLLSYGIDIRRMNDAERLQNAQSIAEEFRRMAPAAHKAFIASLELTYLCGDYLFVHAGIRPGITLQNQAQRDLIMIREPFLSSDADHGHVVVHGHTPVDEVHYQHNRIGIDTGAVFGGRLTALALENDQRWLIQC